MFYMYEHPFCKVVTSVTTTLRLTDAMYEHPFCKVVTSVDLKITVLRDSMSILFERLYIRQVRPEQTYRIYVHRISKRYFSR